MYIKTFDFRRFFWPMEVNCYVIRVSLNLLIVSVISLHMTLYIDYGPLLRAI
jgi:hypothetical protein